MHFFVFKIKGVVFLKKNYIIHKTKTSSFPVPKITKFGRIDTVHLKIPKGHSIGHYRDSPPEVFLRKDIKICSKFTGKHPCQSMVSIKLQSNFIERSLRRGYFSVDLLHIFRTPFPKNTLEGLRLSLVV